MQRRAFLGFAVSSLAMQLLPKSAVAAAWAPDFAAIRLQDTGMTNAQWQEIAAVQVHLFPTEKNAPGAKDVNAARYLQWVLSDPGLEPQDRDFFKVGLNRLQQLVLSQGGQRFSNLPDPQKESILRKLEQDPQGNTWITELLHYIFEALLTDPVYGGNPNGIGWQWLGHYPGFRRPTVDKRYFLL